MKLLVLSIFNLIEISFIGYILYISSNKIRWHLSRKIVVEVKFPVQSEISGYKIIDVYWVSWFNENCGKRFKDWDVTFIQNTNLLKHPSIVIQVRIKHKNVIPWFMLVKDDLIR